MIEKRLAAVGLKKISIILAILICTLFSSIGLIDSKTEKYVDESIKNAAIAYASARALNAAVSVAQSTQIGISLAGEASFHPLEILDPVNDMVEDYATVMKYAIGSLITQKLLIEIFSTGLFKWILAILGLASIVGVLFYKGNISSYVLKVFTFSVFIRFVIALSVVVVTIVDSSFLYSKTNENIDQVSQAEALVGFSGGSIGELSTEEKMKINQEILDLQKQQDALKKTMEENGRKISMAEDIVKVKKGELDKIDGDKKLIEKLNVFNSDIKSKEAKDQLKISEESLESFLDDQREMSEELQGFQEKKSELEAFLRGESGALSSVKRKATAIKSLFDTDKVVMALEKSIKAMLNLIALFVFKTLIMPIAILWAFWWGFKCVWKIDLREHIGLKTNSAPIRNPRPEKGV